MNDDKYWIFHNKVLKNELAVIKINFQCLIDTIKKLEKSNFTLRDNLLLIENIKIIFEEGGPGIDFTRSINLKMCCQKIVDISIEKNRWYNQRQGN
jgi:hypothetical protein